jgi:hypothetical protein
MSLTGGWRECCTHVGIRQNINGVLSRNDGSTEDNYEENYGRPCDLDSGHPAPPDRSKCHNDMANLNEKRKNAVANGVGGMSGKQHEYPPLRARIHATVNGRRFDRFSPRESRADAHEVKFGRIIDTKHEGDSRKETETGQARSECSQHKIFSAEVAEFAYGSVVAYLVVNVVPVPMCRVLLYIHTTLYYTSDYHLPVVSLP